MDTKNLVKASCIAVVLPTNGYPSLIIWYEGGVVGEFNTWEDEIENTSPYVDDVFAGYDHPPSQPGFYVWEGELEPMYDDQANFYGKWRPATKEDMCKLVKE